MLNDSGRFAVRCAVLAAAVAACVGEAGAAGKVKCDIQTVVFTNVSLVNGIPQFNLGELYSAALTVNPQTDEFELINPRRLTENDSAEALAQFSQDRKGRIVFDSNEPRAPTDPINTSFLFIMKKDGTERTLLTKGSSATFSPDSRHIAFHASASGAGQPINTDPGAATTDSDIFSARVSLDGINRLTNLTYDHTHDVTQDPPAIVNIVDDADWSPDGQTIIFTSKKPYDSGRNYETQEIWVMNQDGTEKRQLTHNEEEERGPAWSPDGAQIAYMCRRGPDANQMGLKNFKICVMSADGSDSHPDVNPPLTTSLGFHGVPRWTADGQHILFAKNIGGQRQELFIIKADGTGEERQLTGRDSQNNLLLALPEPAANLLPGMGLIKGRCDKDTGVPLGDPTDDENDQ